MDALASKPRTVGTAIDMLSQLHGCVEGMRGEIGELDGKVDDIRDRVGRLEGAQEAMARVVALERQNVALRAQLRRLHH